jgi:hypothetical protein
MKLIDDLEIFMRSSRSQLFLEFPFLRRTMENNFPIHMQRIPFALEAFRAEGKFQLEILGQQFNC